MTEAIVYTSKTGHTRRYAELLAQETGLPAYSLQEAPKALAGKDVIYLGWLMAGGIKGYQAAAKTYRVRALCQVGMRPPEAALIEKAREAYQLPAETPVFHLQGGFDIADIHGPFRLVMKAVCKKIQEDLGNKADRTPGEEATLRMATTGYDAVSAENLAGVLAWYRKAANP